ncbi:MAG: type II toxin-antitoxin system YafQ family toxin [Gammaproteobacteria bacterium]
MLEPIYSNKFKKEYVLALKRGIQAKEIDAVLSALIKEEKLADKFRDHLLVRNYQGYRECHVKNDYLLWRVDISPLRTTPTCRGLSAASRCYEQIS